MIKKIILLTLVIILMFLNTGCIKKKTPNCESQIVKNMALDIVKKNDWYYPDIAPNTISKVYLKYPAATKYDKDIDKYYCKAQFVVESTEEGFKPSKIYDHYYLKSLMWFDNFIDKIEKNNLYICEIEYSSQISEGNILVESDHCSANDSYTTCLIGKHGVFSCEGKDCEPITINNPKSR